MGTWSRKASSAGTVALCGCHAATANSAHRCVQTTNHHRRTALCVSRCFRLEKSVLSQRGAFICAIRSCWTQTRTQWMKVGNAPASSCISRTSLCLFGSCNLDVCNPPCLPRTTTDAVCQINDLVSSHDRHMCSATDHNKRFVVTCSAKLSDTFAPASHRPASPICIRLPSC